MSGPRVLVSGASIAGPALAHWLRRWDAEVTVVERAPGLRPGGHAVDARGVAKGSSAGWGWTRRSARPAPTPPARGIGTCTVDVVARYRAPGYSRASRT